MTWCQTDFLYEFMVNNLWYDYRTKVTMPCNKRLPLSGVV